MECRDAQFYLRFRRPGGDDLDPDAAAALDRHLADCPACAADARFATSFDAAVATAMRAVPTPAGLRERLVADVSARRGAVLRRRAYRFATVAASLLLTVGLAVGVFTATRPQPDTFELAARGDALAVTLMGDGQQPVMNVIGGQLDPELARKNEEAVRAWLVREGLPPRLPEDFDYGLLLSHHWEEVQGRKVPVVFFRERRGAGFAKVYVLRSTSFDLKNVPNGQASYCQAKPYPDHPAGVTYVVVFSTRDLTPFLKGQGGRLALRG